MRFIKLVGYVLVRRNEVDENALHIESSKNIVFTYLYLLSFDYKT
jgi:hypothetical protein